MWLVSSSARLPPASQMAELLDLSLSVSPHVSEAPEGTLIYSLASLSRYWNLANLAPGEHELRAQPSEHDVRAEGSEHEVRAQQSEHEAGEHRLLQTLQPFAANYGMSFTLAPTAPWAYWLHRTRAPQKLLRRWDRNDITVAYAETSLSDAREMLGDHFHKDPSLHGVFDFVRQKLNDLGVRDCAQLARLASTHDRHAMLRQNLGPLCEKFLRRLKGADDFKISWYVPVSTLKAHFHPGLEGEMSSDDSDSPLLDRILGLLEKWEERLRARRSLLMGLKLRLRMERKRNHVSLEIPLPRATREAQSLFKILRERWFKLAENTGKHALALFEDEISEVEIESTGLTPDHDRQLDLFEPQREETEENWNMLIGRLRAQVPSQKSMRVGVYRPFESYFPEHALEWIEWEDCPASCAPVGDHPQRPPLLLNPPQPQRQSARSEEEFLNFVTQKGAAFTLERVRDPWRGPDECERTYARVDNQWLFWDSTRAQVFLHGYFE